MGDPLSPTIFNMVVDVVIWHWVTLVAGEEAVLDRFGQEIQWLAEFFYTYDGLFVLPRPAWLQAALDVLTVLLDRIGLHNNVNKTVGMVRQTYYIIHQQSETESMWRMTVVGQSFWEQQREIFQCLEFEVELAAGSLDSHNQA